MYLSDLVRYNEEIHWGYNQTIVMKFYETLLWKITNCLVQHVQLNVRPSSTAMFYEKVHAYTRCQWGNMTKKDGIYPLVN